MSSHARSAAGQTTAAFVSWLVTGAAGPALVALPVNLAADKLARAAVRWFKRLRQTDDLSRLTRVAAGTSVELSRAEVTALRQLLEEEQTWRLLAAGTLNEKLHELTGQIAACLPARDVRTTEDAFEAASAIARGLLEFAVFDLEPEVFQKVVLARLHQMSDQATAVDEALFRLHKDLYALAEDAKDLFRQVMDRLPPGRADLGEVRIYLTTLIDWLNTDPWPQDRGLGGPKLTPAAIERKLRVGAADPTRGQDSDADELARRCSRLVFLGGPGSGKTWLAMRTARICAEAALTALDDVSLDEVELPLYTTCSRLVRTPGDIREALVSSALEWIGDLGGSRIVTALRLLFTERKDEPTLLVIDSLDEASDADATRQRLGQVGSLRPPWRVVLTSRRNMWNNHFDIEVTNKDHWIGELQPLRYPDDVERVIQRWFADQPERGNALAEQIAQRRGLQQAATVPLILAFYCILGGQQPLPEFKHDLYRKVINRMLQSPWRSRSAPPDPDECRATLRTWAWLGRKCHPVSGVGQWENDIPTKPAQLSPAGRNAVDHLAAPRGDPDYDSGETARRFVHRSLREHLVAEYVAKLPVNDAAEALLPHLWYDSDWEYAAPAAVAMHPANDELLQVLMRRASNSEELPGEVSVLDVGGEMCKLLARVAAESKEGYWSPGMATIIGQARLDLARAGHVGDLGDARYWPTSDRQACQALLGLLADRIYIGDAERLLSGVCQLQATEPEKRDARQAALRLLTRKAHDFEAGRLIKWLLKLDATFDERIQARQAILELLTFESASRIADRLIEGFLQLAPTPEDKCNALGSVLERLATETHVYTAAWLADTVVRLVRTAKDCSEARQTLLGRVTNQGTASNDLRAGLVAAVVRLSTTAEYKRQTREAFLAILWTQATAALVIALTNGISRLEPTEKDKWQARHALLEFLTSGITSAQAHLGYPAAQALAKLDPTHQDKQRVREALLALMAARTSCHVATGLVMGLTQLDATQQDKDHARRKLLELLPAQRSGWDAKDLVTALNQLGPPPQDKQRAREALLALLAAQPYDHDAERLVTALVKLDPTSRDKQDARNALLALLATKDSAWVTGGLKTALATLEPTAEGRRLTREAMVMMLAAETNGSIASELAGALQRMNPTPFEQNEAREILLGLLAAEAEAMMTKISDGAIAESLAWSIAQMDPSQEDKRATRHLLLKSLNGRIDADKQALLALRLLRFGPTPEELRQARQAILKSLAAHPYAWPAGHYIVALLGLNPTAADKQKARLALLKILNSDPDPDEIPTLMTQLARLDPTVGDLTGWRGWQSPPTKEVLTAARRNSAVSDWLTAVASLPGITH